MSLQKGNPRLWLRQTVKPGMVCIDVGAHKGEMSLEMARAGAAKVYSIEPDETIWPELAETLKPYPCCEIVKAAAWSEGGIHEFHPDGSRGSLYQDAAPGRPAVTVPLLTLDSLQLAKADVVKIDAQGAEVDILAGARDLLVARAQWIVEVWPHGLKAAGWAPMQLWGWFRTYDYQPCWIDGNGHTGPVTLDEFKPWATTEQAPHEHINMVFRPV